MTSSLKVSLNGRQALAIRDTLASALSGDLPPDRREALTHGLSRLDRQMMKHRAAEPDQLTAPDIDKTAAGRAMRMTVLALSAFYDYPPEVFFNEHRGHPDQALARQIAMYLMHTVFGIPLMAVGPAFGRDRTTANLAARRIEALRSAPELDEALNELASLLQRLKAISDDYERGAA